MKIGSGSKPVDDIIMHCKKCNKCWEKMEIEKSISGQPVTKQYITRYDDFVTYGKKKITCPVFFFKTSHATMLRDLILYEIIKS